MDTDKIKVLVVDDAVVIRRMVSEVIGSDPHLEVVGAAANGKIALRKIREHNPDVITLDIEMPEMDGITTLREIRKTNRTTPIIMLSSLTRAGAEMTFEALAAGATDYLPKPSSIGDFMGALEDIKRMLIPRIKAHFPNIAPKEVFGHSLIKEKPSRKPSIKPTAPPRAICVGASTGGPNALETLFTEITTPLKAPIFIVQHMPPVFTKTLADRLDRISRNKFQEAEPDQPVEEGNVYVAPGGKHMEVRRVKEKPRIFLHEGPMVNSCRPAVDILFQSAAETYGSKVLGLVLTGMGHDGLKGCQALKDVGGRILVQDKATSVVWGMPRAVWEAELADEMLPLKDMPAEIMNSFSKQPAALGNR